MLRSHRLLDFSDHKAHWVIGAVSKIEF